MAAPATCSTCRYWHRIDASKAGRAQSIALGECRLNPPTGFRNWSRTQDKDHCAQHKPTERTKPQPAPETLLG